MNAPCFTGRVQAQQPAASLCATTSIRGVQVPQCSIRAHRISGSRHMPAVTCSAPATERALRPDSTGRFGRFGGKYVPETLITALAELEQAYAEAMNDAKFRVSGMGRRTECLGCIPR
jgi:hypothetical protein